MTRDFYFGKLICPITAGAGERTIFPELYGLLAQPNNTAQASAAAMRRMDFMVAPENKKPAIAGLFCVR